MGRHKTAAPAPASLPALTPREGQAKHGLNLKFYGNDLPEVVLPWSVSGDHLVEFFVPAEAVGKARARSALIPKKGGGFVTGKNGRPIITHYTPKNTVDYEHRVAWYARQQMASRQPFTGPIALVLRIGTLPTETWPKWKMAEAFGGLMLPTMKPDSDNIEKAIKDALNGVCWVDDVQVVFNAKAKAFRDVPGVLVTVMQLAQHGSSAKTIDEYQAGHPIVRGLINDDEPSPF